MVGAVEQVLQQKKNAGHFCLVPPFQSRRQQTIYYSRKIMVNWLCTLNLVVWLPAEDSGQHLEEKNQECIRRLNGGALNSDTASESVQKKSVSKWT